MEYHIITILYIHSKKIKKTKMLGNESSTLESVMTWKPIENW